MDARLAVLQDFDGRPLFYPPGQHPATARLRGHLRQLYEHREFFPNDPNIRALIDKVEQQITMFEEMQSERKQEMLHRLDRAG